MTKLEVKKRLTTLIFPDYEEQANYSHNNNIFVRKSSNISFVMFFSQENEAFGVFGKVL